MKVGGQLAGNLAVNFLPGTYGLTMESRVGGQLAAICRWKKLADRNRALATGLENCTLAG
jgi:hypothetical protein